MSVKQPQTFSAALAILTLFATTAWGQQNLPEAPVYKSDRSIFRSDSLVDSDGYLKLTREDMEKDRAASAAAVLQTSQSTQQQADSLFESDSTPMVNKDGYYLSDANGGLWKDAAPGTQPVARENAIPESIVAESAETESFVQPVGQQEFGAPSKFRLSVGFDALMFQRGRGENTVFATSDSGQEWAFDDFDFSEGTARFFVRFMGDDQSGFELTFFDFNSFSSTIAAEGDNVEPSFFGGGPAGTANSYDLNYTSRLKNIEINSWVRHSPTKRTGYGIRHINLDESFDVITGGNTASGLFSRTDNDLWGLNKMWERRRPLLNRMTLVGGVDAGLYLNRSMIDVDTLNLDDSSDAKNLAGSLGFNLGVEYRVADHVQLRLGYEGLGLFGVALASTQSIEQEVINGLNDPELGSIYFGGFYVGAIATF